MTVFEFDEGGVTIPAYSVPDCPWLGAFQLAVLNGDINPLDTTSLCAQLNPYRYA